MLCCFCTVALKAELRESHSIPLRSELFFFYCICLSWAFLILAYNLMYFKPRALYCNVFPKMSAEEETRSM